MQAKALLAALAGLLSAGLLAEAVLGPPLDYITPSSGPFSRAAQVEFVARRLDELLPPGERAITAETINVTLSESWRHARAHWRDSSRLLTNPLFLGYKDSMFSLVDTMQELAAFGAAGGARELACRSKFGVKYVRGVLDTLYGGPAGFAYLLQAGREPAHAVQMFRYLRQVAGATLAYCAEQAAFSFDVNVASLDPGAERMLDNVVSHLAQHGAINTGSLAFQARLVDLKTMDMGRVQRINQLAQQLDPAAYGGPDARQNALAYLGAACKPIAATLEPTMDGFNLARLLGAIPDHVELGPRMAKLNEYKRICNALVDLH